MANSGNLSDFKQDRVFSFFLTDDFNLQNTIASINNLPFNDQLAKISSGIEYVKLNISLLTSQNCEEFFQRTSKLDDLYQELQFIQIKSQNLSKTLELIKSKLEVPYQQLLRQIFLISRLQKTCDLLRKMLRIIHLSKRIYECNLEAFKHEHELTIYLKEIVKVSQYLSEVDMIIASDEEKLLFKLKLIGKDLQRIKQIKLDLSNETDQLMTNGLNNSDLNVISTALQVFHNLGQLDDKLNALINEKCSLVGQAVTKSLKIPELKSGKSGLSIGPNSSIRTTLRNNLKSMLDSILSHFNQISTVVKLLKKKRDNFSQNLLIESIANKDETMSNCWNQIVQILSSLITKQVNESMALKKLIESDYPKVLTVFLDFWKAVIHSEPDIASEKLLRSVVLNFESAYLSNSLSVLFDSVNRIFSDAKEPNKFSSSTNSKVFSVPSEKDVDKIIKSVNHELSIASIDSQLASSVCKNVLKTINLFMVRCEHLALVDGDSTQVIGPFTNSQRHNALIVHILNFFAKQIRITLKNYSHVNNIKCDVEETLSSIDNLVLTIFEPLINSVQDAIEAIILTMYSEDFNIASNLKNDEPVQCSLYMKELQRFIARVSQDYLNQFSECPIIEKRISQMASTTIDSFLLHKCLLSPVSNIGRKKIFADFTQLEFAIVPICERMGDLGRSYQVLRAFKTLLFLSPEDIAKSSVLGNPVPFYLILHFLISNYAPDELKSPQKYMDWSVTRYIKWVDNSSEEQRLTLINDVLDSYVKQVRKSQMKTFASIYPILIEIMKRALNDKTTK